jgi:hypothetical protein
MEVPAKRAEALGRPLLVTFLGRARKVTRLAGRDPPVSTFMKRHAGQQPRDFDFQPTGKDEMQGYTDTILK